MRFLLDQNLSPDIAGHLVALGHDAIHVRDLGLSRASDEQVMAESEAGDRILVSSDTDFGELLALSAAKCPSVVLLRRQAGRRASQIATLISVNLENIADDLGEGAIVVFDDSRIRVRPLPIAEEA